MIGVLLVSHGKMAEGMKNSIEMVVGESQQFEVLALNPGQDVGELQHNILNTVVTLNRGKGVLVFTDIYGASPFNASMRCVPEWQKMGVNVRVITGMSLPMVITALLSRDDISLQQLAQEAIKEGVENIQDAMTAMEAPTLSAERDDY